MQQQDLDQSPGALGASAGLTGRCPERVVGRGELPALAGRGETGGVLQGSGLVPQDLQVVVQQVPEAVAARQTRVADHDLVAVEDPNLVRPQ
ncbi:hypothetical protein ACIQZB_37510 [Streptomyces sp. NPDC097727]|uniref:hypothetical protein n=1 Tax=Streptomyces sp. NPDC097727 TaxID=3366092 RepID=UPI0037FFA183